MRRDVPAGRTVGRGAFGRDAGYCSVESSERVHVLDGEVGAERDARAVVDDAAEGVETLHALGSLRVWSGKTVSTAEMKQHTSGTTYEAVFGEPHVTDSVSVQIGISKRVQGERKEGGEWRGCEV